VTYIIMVAADSIHRRNGIGGRNFRRRGDLKEEEADGDKINQGEQIGLLSAEEDAAETGKANIDLLPDSPPRSPKKEEQTMTDADSDQRRSSSSRQASLSIDSPKARSKSPRNGIKALKDGPTQFATGRPRAENKAFKTFEAIKSSIYQNAKVGKSRGHEKEAMVCECHYRHGVDDPSAACTEEADCINRITQVECIKSECNCGQYCQNQRFQKGQYADVEIIDAGKKGFGLRAGADISA
jgi:hypothetical protein